jgi:hypothetical protein
VRIVDRPLEFLNLGHHPAATNGRLKCKQFIGTRCQLDTRSPRMCNYRIDYEHTSPFLFCVGRKTSGSRGRRRNIPAYLNGLIHCVRSLNQLAEWWPCCRAHLNAFHNNSMKRKEVIIELLLYITANKWQREMVRPRFGVCRFLSTRPFNRKKRCDRRNDQTTKIRSKPQSWNVELIHFGIGHNQVNADHTTFHSNLVFRHWQFQEKINFKKINFYKTK